VTDPTAEDVLRAAGRDDVLADRAAGPSSNGDGLALEQAHRKFRCWLAKYDTDALDAVLCTLAAHELGGDPLWLLIISGAGNAKTEVVQATAGADAIVVSTISSDAALLSGTPKGQRAKSATGGLLREVGDQGVLAIKDVTSVLSMQRDTRAAVLAALREIYDGHWVRRLGVDGGRIFDWKGRLTVIGAVTTAWDRAHDVISSMGDRFVLLRTDSGEHRVEAGRKAIANTGDETKMRAELADAVADVFAAIDLHADVDLTEDETGRLLAAADLVTRARTGVEFDYRGDVIDAHAPEMPTRFTKQLVQVARGAMAIGMDRDRAMRLALRCARDSMPPLRLAIVDDVAAHPGSGVRDVRRRINKPRNTVDRQLQALHMLGVLDCDEEEDHRGVRWRYRLADGINPRTLVVPDLSVHTHSPMGERPENVLSKSSDISGTTTTPAVVGNPGEGSSVTNDDLTLGPVPEDMF
jgi:hypothetical protein